MSKSDDICPICLEKLNCKSLGQCSTCNQTFHPECITEWMHNITDKICPHCRASDSITINGRQIPEKTIAYWCNGEKKFELITEDNDSGEKKIIEKRWWGDGEPKYEIIFNSNYKIISGSYFTYKGEYDITSIPEVEIEKVRSNPIHFIMIDGDYL